MIESRVVPVPCYLPLSCPKCSMTGTLNLQGGEKEKIVITKDGRFDLNSTLVCCSSDSCSYGAELTEKDYIQSNWWPGTPSSSTYLFSEDLLQFWFHLKHQNLGSSERKFIETLNRISKASDRVDVINRTLFNKASREYDYFVYGFFDTDIRQQNKTSCPACGDNPSAACVDGNFRLPRLESASKGYDESLLKNAVIAKDEQVNSHIKQIDEDIVPERQKNPCGGNVFKAAKDSSTNKKHLDETGLIMACCRHLIILQAILWVGHWIDGVGATVGEEQEQVNASMSLYGNRTKHMTPGNRNDTLSAGMMYLNSERFDRMPKFLASRLLKSRILAEAFSMELKDLLETFKLSETDLPGIKDRLKKKAASSARKNDDGPGPPCYLMNDLEAQYSEMQILKKRREKTAKFSSS
ncbi:hypothetical protein DAPPUDRAFT_269147 [Daphnia pulex]|uniref:CxC3 like cysteine cluster domain-containing protein n=1 Tax=Daphnia pulex TaxID=6669 RepID=E9HYX3_DAPPU|nr:hypothetical protein DAPPUDRAFT_269147 [Daphnia pulex]|eukprot:EFX63057.1 hypothetical protein DAPPUDRAFT_269147 [Daphnia pulex]